VAVDARYGRLVWHYRRVSEGDHIGHRGVAMYKESLYFTTPDAHLVCLNAKDGSVRWIVELADGKLATSQRWLRWWCATRSRRSVRRRYDVRASLNRSIPNRSHPMALVYHAGTR